MWLRWHQAVEVEKWARSSGLLREMVRKEEKRTTTKCMEIARKELWAGHFCGRGKGAPALSRSLEGK